jgi:hypothetical protein
MSADLRRQVTKEKEAVMTLWLITPSAGPGDSRWLSYPIWSEVVVRAPTAARARLVAEHMEAEQLADPTPVGNESLVFRSAFQDEKLYHVRRAGPGDAPECDTVGDEEVLVAKLGFAPRTA